MVRNYRKKPVVIEAVQFTHDDAQFKALCDFAGSAMSEASGSPMDTLIIKTLEGEHIASLGDYIIKGVKGEFYPCKPDIFEATYEAV